MFAETVRTRAELEHDVGHSLATLSYLTDALREDPSLLVLVELELHRLLGLVEIRSAATGSEEAAPWSRW